MKKDYKRVRIEICGQCFGEGQEWKEDSPPRHGSDHGEGHFEQCGLCGGTGKVKVTKETTVTVEPA